MDAAGAPGGVARGVPRGNWFENLKRELRFRTDEAYLICLGGLEVLQNPLNRLFKPVAAAAASISGHKAETAFTLDKGRAAEQLRGKVCIVTGGNAGVGLATATELTACGAHVIIGCRSAERGAAAVRVIEGSERVQRCASPGTAEVLPLDLSSLASARDFAAAFRAKGLSLDVLVANAGIMAPPQRGITRDGFESQWQVNYLSHFLLTQLMLEDAAPASRGASSGERRLEGIRVVNVTSMTHHGGRLHFDDINFSRAYRPLAAYAQSKLAIVVASTKLQRRRPDITAVSVHPGLVDTDLARGFFYSKAPRPLHWLLTPLFPYILKTPQEALETMMFAITAPASVVAGQYVAEGRLQNSSRVAQEVGQASKLWATSLAMVAPFM